VKSSAFVFVVVLGACAAAPPPVVNVPPPDLNVPPISVTTPHAATAEARQCHLTLKAGPIQKSSPGCWLTESISKAEGTLTYPCNGDGVVEAIFDTETFNGRMNSFELELESKNEIDWEGDHCRWGSTANIRGGPVGSATAKLVWSYHDYVVRGERCSGACTASADFSLVDAH
jgi:hypothetical protein